jgi:energy-coupling factor transport system substrate-specific component
MTARLGRAIPVAVPMRGRTVAAMLLVSFVGAISFGWPLLAEPGSGTVAHASDAPLLFAVLLPLVLIVLVAAIADGGLDAKALAMLGVLSAVGAALRPFGSGIAGIEPVWIVVILGGRALGPAFGFLLGSTTLFVSALVTGGVGPWLPFQMLGAAWLGCGAGLLPRTRRAGTELLVLLPYTVIASLAYGLLLNLWLWPWTPGLGEQVSFVAGAPIGENVQRWFAFTIATSLAWDLSRGITSAIFVALASRPLLTALRRGARRANFAPSPTFRDSGEQREESAQP